MPFDRFLRTVASNIRKARLDVGLTQEDMAKFGFNVRHYQDIEAGRVRCTLETLYRLACAFKKGPEDLLDAK